MNTFVKTYPSAARAQAAARHLAWLSTLDSGVGLPRRWDVIDEHLRLERLTGRPPTPDDMPAVADALGQLHHAAHTRHLHAATLDVPLLVDGFTIPDFRTPRRAALRRQPVPYRGLPAALYKDSNIRNILITADGIALVDFDDLTLAPFGYDLAKLVVTTAMTHGVAGDVDATLDAYNARVHSHGCAPQRLHAYAELHHTLTARYLGRNGYRHPWPQVRPWPAPADTPTTR